MKRTKTAFIAPALVTLVLMLGLPILFESIRERNEKEMEEMSSFLAASLQIGMQADSSIVAASVSLVETGSGKNPYSSFLAYRWDKPELMDFDYCIDRIPVVPAGMMQGPTVTFFMDKKCITADGLIPTSKGILPGIHLDSWGHDRDDHVFSYENTSGKGSISVRDGFLMSSHYVSAKIALDHDCYWREYLDKFDDYFGSSDAYYVPNVWNGRLIKDKYTSVADGLAIHLSQWQVLRFYDSIANGGVRPRHRYLRRRRICSSETAEEMKYLLRENVTNGTGRLLAGHPARIAGKTGSGIMYDGYIPGARNQIQDPVWASSFAGFFPVESPKYTMCVTVYYNNAEPRNATAPMRLFGEIADDMLKEGMLWKK